MRTVDELHQQLAFERRANRTRVESPATVEPSEAIRRVTWHLLAAIDNGLARSGTGA